jgi:beta-glucanase (GH16 family)
VRPACNAGQLTPWFVLIRGLLIRGQKQKLSIQYIDVEFTKACPNEMAYGEQEAMGNTICECHLTTKGHCLNKKQYPKQRKSTVRDLSISYNYITIIRQARITFVLLCYL